MPFNSPTFLFAFLPLFLAAYWSVRSRPLRNGLLFGASLLFYAWGEGRYVLLLLLSIAANLVVGVWLERSRRTHRESLASWVGVALNLLPLAVLKYGAFLVSNLNVVLLAVQVRALELPTWRLPAGISFFTFMALSYLIAVHRGEVPAQRNPLRLGFYVSLFPLTMAGPICRYLDLAP